jgi:hypothetical protein
MRSFAMKRLSFLGWFALSALTACSDDADIGVDSKPVNCATDVPGFADVSGSVKDPTTGTQYDFNQASPEAYNAGQQTTLSLRGEALQLQFAFYCGQAQLATYGVKGDTQDGLDCPLEVASEVLGRIEYLPAKSGTMIVDQNSNCLAGRFRVDFGANGSISGSFSSNWTPTP